MPFTLSPRALFILNDPWSWTKHRLQPIAKLGSYLTNLLIRILTGPWKPFSFTCKSESWSWWRLHVNDAINLMHGAFTVESVVTGSIIYPKKVILLLDAFTVPGCLHFMQYLWLPALSWCWNDQIAVIIFILERTFLFIWKRNTPIFHIF